MCTPQRFTYQQWLNIALTTTSACSDGHNGLVTTFVCAIRSLAMVTYPVVRKFGATVFVLRDLAQANTCDLCYDRPEGTASIEVSPADTHIFAPLGRAQINIVAGAARYLELLKVEK
ncbi:hypothetical protein HR45_13425 [Shewanella mangrovi]|uniref:Uncharacterized protein n=1 Tax=Shewanella mangrovi TaxID=1515746 RepID=A0A094JG74_9GAMM|nr:hypothetical protein HR45_13425 [Shewanella mangrovi]